jgi:transcriptional regulator NrdR family protein
MYDRTKIQRSILKSFNKRKMDIDKIDQMINDLESEWASNKK